MNDGCDSVMHGVQVISSDYKRYKSVTLLNNYDGDVNVIHGPKVKIKGMRVKMKMKYQENGKKYKTTVMAKVLSKVNKKEIEIIY